MEPGIADVVLGLNVFLADVGLEDCVGILSDLRGGGEAFLQAGDLLVRDAVDALGELDDFQRAGGNLCVHIRPADSEKAGGFSDGEIISCRIGR